MATLFIGQNKIFLPQTESTNSYAIGLLKNVNPPEGSIVCTDHQTEGRGQRGNTWEADPSMNITFSLILKPVFLNVKNSFYLSKMTALALHDVLTEALRDGQFDIKIKWPNDMLVNGKKIAGTLIENSCKEDRLLWSVVGIGLNVNQDVFKGLPDAVSLKMLAGKNHDRDGVMNSLLIYLEKWYLKLRSLRFDEIDTAYLSHLHGMNELVQMEKGKEKFQARIAGVNESGELLADLGTEVKAFEVKEIRISY